MTSFSRRSFLVRALSFVAAAPALASCEVSSTKERRYGVGFLSHNHRASTLTSGTMGIVRQTFSDLGYVEGRTLSLTVRYAEGDRSALPGYAAELLALPVDVLMAEATPATLVAQTATDTVPIVFLSVNDPVGQKIVASLSHPGQNITGVTTRSGALSAKRLEYFKTAVPNLTRIAVLWNAENAGQELVLQDTISAATVLGIAVRTYGISSSTDLEIAFAEIASDRPEGLLALANMDDYRAPVVDFAMRYLIPHMLSSVLKVASYHPLMAFGPDYDAQTRRAVIFVDRILRGTNPGDIPVEDPTRALFSVDLSVARRLGITIPAAVLRDATQVIE